MKEIKAYIRTSCLDKTIQTLQAQGAPGITVVTVHPVGYGFDSRFTMSEVEISKKYYDITKIEVVCDDEKLDILIDAILNCAQTGSSGDGLIFVTDVDEAIKIRSGKRGTKFLELSS